MTLQCWSKTRQFGPKNHSSATVEDTDAELDGLGMRGKEQCHCLEGVSERDVHHQILPGRIWAAYGTLQY
ncbi:MAG: hypothetical protein EA399_07385 [Desulfovibrionales bacterium]|nr:MAG: hypothetical protein EA399_07385 [Desulfovibrionales bacterium]